MSWDLPQPDSHNCGFPKKKSHRHPIFGWIFWTQQKPFLCIKQYSNTVQERHGQRSISKRRIPARKPSKGIPTSRDLRNPRLVWRHFQINLHSKMASRGRGSSLRKDGFDYNFRIVLVGDQGVGKSTLIRRYVQGIYQPGMKPDDSVDTYYKDIEKLDKKVRLEIRDTAGAWIPRGIIYVFICVTDSVSNSYSVIYRNVLYVRNAYIHNYIVDVN